jgi:hypothetical protein
MRKHLLLVTLLGVGQVLAQPLDPKDVPDPLKPWTQWVLRGHEGGLCPALARAETLSSECLWPASLELQVSPQGATFRLKARRYTPGFVTLPGSDRLWPVGVHLGGKPTPVVAQHGAPVVETTAGEISVEGAFLWDSPRHSRGQ